MNYFRITFLSGAVQLMGIEKSLSELAAQWTGATVEQITAEQFDSATVPLAVASL